MAWKMMFAAIVCILFIAAEALPAEQGGRGRNKRIYVVPRTKPVTVDGKLDDWDLSGQILICVTQESSEMQSAKVAMMYDDQALYVCGELRDPSPMMNKHDPKVDADRAWDADAFQLRMALDPKMGFPINVAGANDQLVHMLLWYYTDRKEANLQFAYGMTYAPPKSGWPQGVVPRDKFDGAYLMSPDKKGCTFEYRIPWATLDAKTPPKAGDLVASSIQIQWGSADGLSSTGGGWAMDLLATPGFSFQSTACWGRAIFSEKGNLPKELTQEDLPVEPPLPLTFTYDLPDDGDVTIALYDGTGQMARHVLAQASRKKGTVTERWDGLGDATPGGAASPLPAATYAWKGLYHKPITTKHLLSVHNSGVPAYATADGTGSWGADHGRPSTVCAADDYMVLAWDLGEAGWSILRTTLMGRKQWGIKQGAVHLAVEGDRIFASGGGGFFEGSGVQCFSLADGRPLNFGRGTPKAEVPAGGDADSNTVTGLACGKKGELYVSYEKRNMVAMYDSQQGTIAVTREVPAPGRLAVLPNGALLVISQPGRLGGKIVKVPDGKPFIADHLDSPVSVALAAPGGADAGRIYVANRGKLQNVSVFGADGKYLSSIGKEGGRPSRGLYDKKGMLEPGGIAVDKLGKLWVAETLDSPKRISVWDTQSGEFVREFFGSGHYATSVSMDPKVEDEVYCHDVIWKVNLDKGIWYAHSTMWRSADPNQPETIPYSHYVITAKNGKQYAWTKSSVGSGPMLFRRDGDVFKPLLMCFRITKDPAPYPALADKARFPEGTYVWLDANDDQLVQPQEVTKNETFTGFAWVDADLNVWSEASGGCVLRPVKIEANGRPVYDPAKVEKTGIAGAHEFGGLFCDSTDAGSLYTIIPDAKVSFARWSLDRKVDRKLLWHYPVKSWRAVLNMPVSKPGQVWGITSGMGTAGDFTAVATYFGPFHILTRDGIYVATVFKDARLGETGPDVINAEAFSGQFVKLERSGRYLILAGDTDGRVTEVRGLDSVKRFAGTCTITADDVKKVSAALAEYGQRKARAQKLTIVRGRPALPLAAGVSKVIDDKRAFTVRAAYDEQSLYLDYSVESPFDLVNSIPDPQTIFKGGNLLDIQLAADPAADPKRAKPAPGDVRILVTRQNEKPVAIIYRPKIKDFKGQAIVLKSPTGQESFDAIEAGKIGLEYARTPAGFRAVVTVPLDVLGWKPQAGATVKMDLGYLFGNSTGNQCAQRSYWANASPTSGIIGDVPSESRLEPSHWGTAGVE